MTIGIIQPNIISNDIEKNLQHCEGLMKSLPNAANMANMPDGSGSVQVFLLPEMFATGFPASREQAEPPLLPHGTEPPPLSENDNGQAKIQMWMKRMAQELNAVVAGTVAVKEVDAAAVAADTITAIDTTAAVDVATTIDTTAATTAASTNIAKEETIYNRLIWMRPTGEYFAYDKKHLFGAEKETYEQGTQIVTVQEQGWNFRLNVCYDLRFPIWCKNRRLYGDTLDYDIVIFPSSWPTSRINVWKTLLPARAVENLAYSIGINRSGKDINGTHYNGQSTVSDAQGNIITQLDEKPQAITVTLDKRPLERLREHLTVSHDWDEYELKQ
ncbi:MAG: hypothetical protein LBC49_04390 [Bacteroidales bacterium]|jgi:predicted amidohydrolase|nr:hypothetical protein [Bacteroidales bacterium]